MLCKMLAYDIMTAYKNGISLVARDAWQVCEDENENADNSECMYVCVHVGVLVRM